MENTHCHHCEKRFVYFTVGILLFFVTLLVKTSSSFIQILKKKNEYICKSVTWVLADRTLIIPPSSVDTHPPFSSVYPEIQAHLLELSHVALPVTDEQSTSVIQLSPTTGITLRQIIHIIFILIQSEINILQCL